MGVSTARYRFGTLGKIINDKLTNDNDAKVIIQAENSQTGVGKTTLAVQLCRYVDPDWNPQNRGAYWNVDKYVNDYNRKRIPAGSAVLLDEIEMLADTRRSMSNKNLKLSQAWARLRNRNVLNVATLPSVSMLDKRLLELADFWILVRKRGIAQPYHIQVNDFTHKIRREPFEGDEHIKFKKIPHSDEDYHFIEEMKSELGASDFEMIPEAECDAKVEKAREEGSKEYRDQLIKAVYAQSDLTYEEIGNLEPVGLTKQTVGQIIRGEQ